MPRLFCFPKHNDMSDKRKAICNVFGHEWESLATESYRSKSSLAYRVKSCIRCGKREYVSSLKFKNEFASSREYVVKE
jgi:hypothetical protein